MIEGSGNTEAAIDARVIVYRYAPDSLRFQEGDQLIAPDIEKEVAKPAAFFDRYVSETTGLNPRTPSKKSRVLSRSSVDRPMWENPL
jgi:hypothetical protein